ncbi:MAG: hypothetical protein EOP20_00845 [Hyphomicrobiales bacterium]|nr:MAG: hypothetical protein EOP20_00845 [Hyphomicrobiales bacterium]
MAKNAIADFDIVPDNNTDIGGVDIRGTSLVLNFDNALRTLMAYLKVSYNEGTQAGLRNLIINGDFRINQRAVSTKAQSVGVYGYDRWKGHEDGLEQVIEGVNVGGGSHTLSWTGGGQGRLAGGALTVSPITVSLTAGANVSVVVPAAATNVQLEPGNIASPFERRPLSLELALCGRYFVNRQIYGSASRRTQDNNGDISGAFALSRMRVSPTLSFVTNSGAADGEGSQLIFPSLCSFSRPSVDGAFFTGTLPPGTGSSIGAPYTYTFVINASAEL